MKHCSGVVAMRSRSPSTAAVEAAERSVEMLAEARAREGERLAAVLAERVAHLRSLANATEPLVPGTVTRMQQRFLERWQEALDKAGAAQSVTRAAIEERALNEAAAYAIRIDVAEELARLRSHLDEIARLLEHGRRDGQAPRVPDPGVAARGEHARLEVAVDRDDDDLGRHEGRDRAAA